MAANNLQITITAVDKASGQIRKVNSELKNMGPGMRGATSATNVLAASVKTLASGAVLGALVAGLKTTISLAAEQERVE